MAKITLVTGGAASGKSRWAVSYFAECDNVLYLCAAPHIDKETAERIRWNSRAKAVNWRIIENSRIRSVQPEGHKYIIYDSLARYTADMITALSRGYSGGLGEKDRLKMSIAEDVERLIDKVNETGSNLVIITNETGFSVTPTNDNQRVFREILGFVNQRTANMAAEVYMSVSGVQMKIK